MASYFVPYTGKKPAALSINGHRLIIVSRDRLMIEEHLEVFGADRVRRVAGVDSKVEEEVVFDQFAKLIKGGVVVAPADSDFSQVLKNLEHQLPW
ncbi:MAG: hypothetical protein J0M12_15220, partial [Deltaproteobacteria bacterium]|nr:hypothetical protein [Deltaproteobacteria bacterium]